MAPKRRGLSAPIGPSLRFHSDTTIALTGALSPATLDGEPVPFHQAVKVTAGQLLVIGKVTTGCEPILRCVVC